MPRDISTRWNSMFNMLVLALEYKTAVDDIVGNKVANMQQYELSDEEWRIAEQLHDTLKVGVCLHIFFQLSIPHLSPPCLHLLFLALHPLLLQSFQPWTIYMKHSPLSLSTLNMSHLSMLHLVLPRECSTVITLLPTNQKCIISQWVRDFFQLPRTSI